MVGQISLSTVVTNGGSAHDNSSDGVGLGTDDRFRGYRCVPVGRGRGDEQSLYTPSIYEGMRVPRHPSKASKDRKMENQDLRRIGVFSCILTFDATNVPLDGTS